MSAIDTDDILETIGRPPDAMQSALILCGGLTPPPLAQALDASLLTLQYDQNTIMSDAWMQAFESVSIPSERCWLLKNNEDRGKSGGEIDDFPMGFLADKAPYRGPAGALRDAADTAKPGGPCLIVECSRVPESAGLLQALVSKHPENGGCITVSTNPDGTFAGILIADPDVFESIPTIGYMDIKEQWLPAAARNGFRILSHQLPERCFSVRSRTDYLEAMRRLGRFGSQDSARIVGHGLSGPFGVAYGGSLVSHTAHIDDEAVTAHSVVCDRAELAAGCVVVRSIVGPGACVGKDDVYIDSVVPAGDDHPWKQTHVGAE